MNIVVALYSAILFFILTPNVLLRLPSNGSKFLVAAIHAAIFGVIIYFTQPYVWKLSVGQQEGMSAINCQKRAKEHGQSKWSFTRQGECKFAGQTFR